MEFLRGQSPIISRGSSSCDIAGRIVSLIKGSILPFKKGRVTSFIGLSLFHSGVRVYACAIDPKPVLLQVELIGIGSLFAGDRVR